MASSLRGCLALGSMLSAASALAAGLIGAFATIRYGPALVMGLAILQGHTEPATPAAPYPWGAWALGAVLALAGLLLLRSRPERYALGHGLLHGGSYLTALVPFLHLLHLWGKT